MTLHQMLDVEYGPDGDAVLRQRLDGGEDPNAREGDASETPLHVATRRRRREAVAILLDHGAEIDAQNGHGKTDYAHALRRGFTEVAELLAERGADTSLADADHFAVAIVEGRLDDARQIADEHPGVVRTGNPEEDRLLADVAGRCAIEPVQMLIEMGADLAAPGLDGGTPLHQTAWFGQPANARLLIDAGAPLDVFDPVHNSSPIHWAAHGSRYSGDAENRQDAYVEVTRMLLESGSSLRYPDDAEGDAYYDRLLRDATPPIESLLRGAKS